MTALHPLPLLSYVVHSRQRWPPPQIDDIQFSSTLWKSRATKPANNRQLDSLAINFVNDCCQLCQWIVAPPALEWHFPSLTQAPLKVWGHFSNEEIQKCPLALILTAGRRGSQSGLNAPLTLMDPLVITLKLVTKKSCRPQSNSWESHTTEES